MNNERNRSPMTVAGTSSTVGSLFRSRAAIQPAAPAIEYNDRIISYGELNERVNRASAMLAAHGVARGDRVALLSRNRPEYLEIELAAAQLGAITACLNWRLSKRELTYCIELVSPKLLIAEAELAAPLDGALSVRDVVTLGADYERALQGQSGVPVAIAAEPEDGLVILYTSGTTGLPKGAVISFRNDEFADPQKLIAFISERGRDAKVRPDMKVVFLADWQQAEDRLKGTTAILRSLAGIADKAKKKAA